MSGAGRTPAPRTGPQDTDHNRPGADRDTVLRCVALPVIAQDLDGPLEAQLRLWADPRFCPVLAPQTHRPHLLIMVNNADAGQIAGAHALFDALPQLEQSFSGLSVHSAGLSGARDLYVRGPAAAKTAYGGCAGPNFLFEQTMRTAGRLGGFTLQIELDCLPVQAGWIEAAQALIEDHRAAWVIGSHFAGTGLLGREVKGHLNGNALYRAGARAFQDFLAGVWMPRLMHHIQRYPHLAYDCWWATECHHADPQAADLGWELFQDYNRFFSPAPLVVNHLAGPPQARAYLEAHARAARLGPPPVFLHGPAMAELRALLLEQGRLSLPEAVHSLDPPAPGTAAPLLPNPVVPHAVPQKPQQPQEPQTGQTPQPGAPRSPAAADRLIRQICARLLLDPVATAQALAQDSDLAQAVAAARMVLGAQSKTLARFDQLQGAAAARADTTQD